MAFEMNTAGYILARSYPAPDRAAHSQLEGAVERPGVDALDGLRVRRPLRSHQLIGARSTRSSR
eukprot:scaffold6918_cov380-Prasinococcus_capsulatus_cf.AAC.15